MAPKSNGILRLRHRCLRLPKSRVPASGTRSRRSSPDEPGYAQWLEERSMLHQAGARQVARRRYSGKFSPMASIPTPVPPAPSGGRRRRGRSGLVFTAYSSFDGCASVGADRSSQLLPTRELWKAFEGGSGIPGHSLPVPMKRSGGDQRSGLHQPSVDRLISTRISFSTNRSRPFGTKSQLLGPSSRQAGSATKPLS